MNTTLVNFEKALSAISDADTLNMAWKLMKIRQNSIGAFNAMAFRVGQRVTFDARSRGIVKGVITKINGKSIKVLADSGMPWKVSASLLTLVK